MHRRFGRLVSVTVAFLLTKLFPTARSHYYLALFFGTCDKIHSKTPSVQRMQVFWESSGKGNDFTLNAPAGCFLFFA
uniref:Putative secreted protein n=1 Tax=Anopheles marajoara TaxID=58244 RepID=A0A2M4CCK8_9DIPT